MAEFEGPEVKTIISFVRKMEPSLPLHQSAESGEAKIVHVMGVGDYRDYSQAVSALYALARWGPATTMRGLYTVVTRRVSIKSR